MPAKSDLASQLRSRSLLSADVASHVRAQIMSGQLLPGDFVRIEGLAETLGISATPAREALQSLRVEGFLRLEPHRGFVIAELTGDDIRELFTAQALIAGEIASRAAANASAGDLARIVAAHQAVVAAADSGDTGALEEFNNEFHQALNRSARTRKLGWVLALLVQYVPREFYGSIPGWPDATKEDHTAIVDALQARDAERARAEMVDHIRHAGELLASHFDERLAAKATQQSESDEGSEHGSEVVKLRAKRIKGQ